MTKHMFGTGTTIPPGEDYRGEKAYGIHHQASEDPPYLNQIIVEGGERNLRDHILVLLNMHEFVPGEKPKVGVHLNKSQLVMLRTALEFYSNEFAFDASTVPEPGEVELLDRKLLRHQEQVS